MKLIRASINNFRLLKDLTLDFSTDPEKPLTVIRAANESGKTTCEYALMWGLWGERALPAKYKDFAIFPADIVASNPKEINARVEIEFTGPSPDTSIETRYRLIREYTRENGTKDFETLNVFEVKSSGTERLIDSKAKLLVDSILPISLKDIYFTDGDRALSFIEAGTQDHIKRRRVSEAIRSLLALDELEASVRHLNNVENKFESEIDNKDYAKELENINVKIEFQVESIKDYKEELLELENEERINQEGKRQNKERIEELLQQGDKKQLIKKRQELERNIQRIESSQEQSLSSIRGLVQGELASLSMLAAPFTKAQEYLKSLKDKNQLPKANIPILQELLSKNECFCGAPLGKDTDIGLKNHERIQATIQTSLDADRKTELATSLHFQVVSLNPKNASEEWMESYGKQMNSYLNFDNMKLSQENEIKEINKVIDSIEDDALDGYRIAYEKYDRELSSIISKISRRQTQVDEAATKIKELNEDKVKLTKKLNTNDKGLQKAILARELKIGFQNILNKLKDEEVKKVGIEMNRIFIEMIGSAPDDNDFASITKAELSPEYDILVYGNRGKLINPDQDLNGASRRAITLAFILALTKVSEVEAPNVIDTPLGMMSGYVKQSVLNQMIKEGSQIVVFLTHDEINGVEKIIDKYADKIYTLTNPAHYPRMLKNKPETKDARILRCECNHRESCDICARNDYQEGV